jgi:hypothetical protein
MTMGLNDLINRSWWGVKREKLSVQRFVFAIATKRSVAKNASIDPGRASLLDSEDLKVMSTDQELMHDGWLLHVDYSRTLTAQENFYVYGFRLAGRKGIDTKRSSRLAAWCQVDRTFPKSIMRKRKANKRVPISPIRRWLQVGTSRNKLAHTFTYFANFEVLTLVVLKVQYFSRLMQCICLCGMVLMMHVRMTRLPICVSDCKGNQSRERICVTSCYLMTKIPCALLVAVGWLQHTRHPGFRRGTFGYGITLSPIKGGRVGVRSFMRMHISIPILPKCICYAAHAQKQHFNSNHKGWARPKETSSGLRNRLDPDWHEIGGAQNLIDRH